MNLKDALARVKTEEDVKDAYIKALGLKSDSKGLVDIQTEEIWFEAKKGRHQRRPSSCSGNCWFMCAQRKSVVNPIPVFLAVIDREKAALMPTEKALPLLDDKAIIWPKSGSPGRQRVGGANRTFMLIPTSCEYEIAHARGRVRHRRSRMPSANAGSSARRSRPIICVRCLTAGSKWSAAS